MATIVAIFGPAVLNIIVIGLMALLRPYPDWESVREPGAR